MEWAFLFLILFLLLLILAIILSIHLIDLKIQIYKINDRLHTILLEDRKEPVTLSLGDKGLGHLAETINMLIAKKKDSLLTIKRREDKLKEDISCLSHDLRTPLTSIRGYIKLLESAPEEKWDEYRNVILKKALTLEGLIDEFYQISLLEDGRYLFEYETLDVTELLTELLLENYSFFKEKEIIPEINIPNHPILIDSDKKACIRIIQNLLFNALEETSGSIKIELAKEEKEVCLIVSNPINDFAMPEPDKLFERFYRKDAARKNGHTGQGLYIVKKLLIEMNCDEPQAYIIDNYFSISVKWNIKKSN